MKRASYISVCFMLAGVLAACNANNEGEEVSPGNQNEENVENNIEENNETGNSNLNEEANEDNVENEEPENENNTNDEENNSSPEIEEMEPQYEIAGDFTIRPIDDADEEIVLLTIDDAPDGNAVEMAEILVELDAPAIFFVNGHFLTSDEQKEQLQQIYDLGFEIGNHTMTHPNLSEISEEEQYEEIVELNNIVEDIIGERPRFFRAPFGVNTDYMRELMEEENMQYMNWTYGYDFEAEYMNEEALAEIMVETEFLRNGANLLMHDREFTKDALASIVEGLREKGYEMVDPDAIK